jgi:hypothetical protein
MLSSLKFFLTSERSEEVPFLRVVGMKRRTGGSPELAGFHGKTCPKNGNILTKLGQNGDIIEAESMKFFIF